MAIENEIQLKLTDHRNGDRDLEKRLEYYMDEITKFRISNSTKIDEVYVKDYLVSTFNLNK